MSCPFCGSTDIADTTVVSKRYCFDCDRTWTSRSQREISRAIREMDWFDRLNTEVK
jgi:hypothetical protein